MGCRSVFQDAQARPGLHTELRWSRGGRGGVHGTAWSPVLSTRAQAPVPGTPCILGHFGMLSLFLDDRDTHSSWGCGHTFFNISVLTSSRT